MKKIIIKSNSLCWIALILVVLASCRKYNSTGFTPGTGAPTITSVHTLSKTDTATYYDTVTAYNSSGDTTLTTNARSGKVSAFDSVTDAGNLGDYYVIYGTNLGSTVSVAFNGVSAYFNPALMSDNSIIVSIPSNTPTNGPLATDTLTVTTLHGTVRYHFVTLPPLPTINGVSDYDFWNGSQITLTGIGFADVTSVGLTGSTATATIVSQNDSVLVLQFPSASVNRANLVFAYTYNGAPTTLTSTQEFVDLDNAYNLFAFGNYQNTWTGAGSWDNVGLSSANGASIVHSYGETNSYWMHFSSGGYHVNGLLNYNAGLADSNYTYLTFWIYGGVQTETINVLGSETPGGFGNSGQTNPYDITVPPGVWTYFKIPLGNGPGQLNYWQDGPVSTSLGFYTPGPSVTEDLYIDEVAFVK